MKINFAGHSGEIKLNESFMLYTSRCEMIYRGASFCSLIRQQASSDMSHGGKRRYQTGSPSWNALSFRPSSHFSLPNQQATRESPQLITGLKARQNVEPFAVLAEIIWSKLSRKHFLSSRHAEKEREKICKQSQRQVKLFLSTQKQTINSGRSSSVLPEKHNCINVFVVN